MKKSPDQPSKSDSDGKNETTLMFQPKEQSGQKNFAITVFKPRIVKTVHHEGIVNMGFRDLVARIRAGGKVA